MLPNDATQRINDIAIGAMDTQILGESFATLVAVQSAILAAISDPTIMLAAAHEQGLV
jgi:hypothetical protein